MAGFVKKLKGIMLGPGYDEDEMYEGEYEDEEEYEEEPRPRLKDLSELSVVRGGSKEKSTAHRSNIVNFNNTPPEHELVISTPKVIEDAGYICDDIVAGKVCVVNLEGIEKENAQRIADFLGGVCYALNGDIERISNEIFVVAPSHVSIRGAINNNLKSGGTVFPSWLAGAFK